MKRRKGGRESFSFIEVLAPGGRLVSLGGAFGPVPNPPPALTDGRKASRFSITNYLKAKPANFRELANLLNLVKESKFQVIIDRSFPLAEARQRSATSKDAATSARSYSR